MKKADENSFRLPLKQMEKGIEEVGLQIEIGIEEASLSGSIENEYLRVEL